MNDILSAGTQPRAFSDVWSMWSDEKLAEALQETKERIDYLEAGRPLQMTERPI